jgi:hypothetical protein
MDGTGGIAVSLSHCIPVLPIYVHHLSLGKIIIKEQDPYWHFIWNFRVVCDEQNCCSVEQHSTASCSSSNKESGHKLPYPHLLHRDSNKLDC